MHEKLIEQLRSDKQCCDCPYDKDCNEFDSCLMDLLAADALEDMNKRIARQEKELEKQKSDMVYVIPTDTDKPLKLVYEDDVRVVENDDGTIKFIRKLEPLEAEQILKCIFGTTDVGILDCSDMTDEEIEKLVDKWNSIPEEYLIPVVDWAKLDCLTMSEEQFTKIYCNNCGTQRCAGVNSEWFDGCKFKDHLSR